MTQQYIVEILGKDKTGQAFKQVQGNVDKAKQSVLNLKNAIIALGTGVAVRSIINATARFQDLRTALTSVTGSAEAGAEAFGFISKFATKTQFGVDDLTETFIKLKSAGITPTEELLTTFTDTAAVTTDQLGSLQAITDLFARSISGGLGLEDLNRLADRGVPVFKILQEQLGLTRLEVSKFGQTAEGANKVRQALIKGLNQSFGGATAERVNNLSTQLSNLGIAITSAQSTLGEGLAPELGKLVVRITEVIESNKELIKQFGEKIGVALNGVVTGFEFLVQNQDAFIDGAKLFIGLKLASVFSGVAVSVTQLNSALEANLLFKFGKEGTRGFLLLQQLLQLDTQLKNTEYTMTQFVGTGNDFLGIFNTGNTRKVQMLKEEFNQLEFERLNRELSLYIDLMPDALQNTKLLALEMDTVNENTVQASDTFNLFRQAQEEGLNEGLQILYEYNEELRKSRLYAQEAGKAVGIYGGETLRLKQILGNQEVKTAEEIEKEKLEILKQGQKETIDKTKNTLSTLAGLNKNAFRAYQAYQIAEATINAYKGASNALATYPPPYSFLAAAASVAQGLALVANIRSQQYSGRALGGRVQDGSTYMVGEQGPEMFVPSQSGTIIPNKDLGRATNVYITVNANDTQGFDELLVKRRSVIVNVINDALNSQGKEALV